MRKVFVSAVFLGFIFVLSSTFLFAYSPPDYTHTFYGDGTGDMLLQVDDIPTHKQYAASGAASYNTTQPQVATQYWNTCDVTGDNLCQVDDIPSLKQVASGNTISILLASWHIDNWNLPLTGIESRTFIPFRLNAKATGGAVVGRPGIIMKVTIDPNGSTTTGLLQGRSCSSGDLHEAGATCAIGVSVTDMASSANSLGLTESASSTTLAVKADWAGTLHLHVETVAQPFLNIPAMTLDLYPTFSCGAGECDIAIDCSNPGPNPVNELAAVQCTVAAAGGSPVLDTGVDTCGGSINGVGPWTYDFTPTEADGPGSCRAAVELASNTSVKFSDLVTINEVNIAPIDNAPATVSGTVLNPININVSPTDSDLPAQILTCSLVSATCSSGSLSGCVWSWTPGTLDGPTSCNVVTRVYDGVAYSSNKTTKVIVTDGGNTAPIDNAPTTITGDELTTISFGTNPTDSESPPQTLTSIKVSAAGSCAYGTLSGHTWSWTPTEAQGPTSCNVVTKVFDGVVYSANKTTHVIVKEVNIPPTDSAPATVTKNELTAVSFTVTKSDPDVPTQTLTCSQVSNSCPAGTLSSCTWSGWTPTEAQGPTSCDVVTRVYDGVAYSSNVTTHVIVNEVNVAPVDNATASVSGTVLNPISFDLNPTDSDIPIQTLTCSQVSNACPGGSLTGCAWSWTPNSTDGPGSCSVVTKVYDGVAYSSNKTTKIIVTDGGNTAPTNNAPATVTGDELTAISFSTNPTDPDSPPQTLTSSVVSATGACAGKTFSGNTWSWTPTEAQGPTSCDVTTCVYDGAAFSGSVTTRVIVNEVQNAPVWERAPDDVVAPTNFVYDMANGKAVDGDTPEDNLTCSKTSQTCSFPITVSGGSPSFAYCKIYFNSGSEAETCSLEIKAQDEHGASVTDTVQISVVESAVGWYVDIDATGADDGTSWTDAFTAPQDAVDAASSGDMVWVAEGTYGEPPLGGETITMKNGVKIYGGFDGTETSLLERGDPASHPTILDGGNKIVFGASNARLDGFTLHNGFAMYDIGWDIYYSGGMTNHNIHDLIVANCKFVDNRTFIGDPSTGPVPTGGAMFNSYASNLQIINCDFIGNYVSVGHGLGEDPLYCVHTTPDNYYSMGGAIYNTDYSNTYIESSYFDGNSAKSGPSCDGKNLGGAIYNTGSLTVLNSYFKGNSADQGGAIYNNYSIRIINSVFESNIVGSTVNTYRIGIGGAIWNGSVVNSLFIKNKAQATSGNISKGGALAYGSSIVNNTFSLNSASSGGAIYSGTNSVIRNCVLWGDIGTNWPEIYDLGGTPTVTYSDIQMSAGSVYTGTGNINSNPLFVSSTDFHLTLGSPCINTGTNTGAPAYDLDGNPRPSPVGGIVDMGAYEYTFPLNIDCSPNPANELTTVSCPITTSYEPQVDSTNDTCGGAISGSGPWTYDFMPTESQGPGTCGAAVQLAADTGVKSRDVVTINEVNQAPEIALSEQVQIPRSGSCYPAYVGLVKDYDIPINDITCSMSCTPVVGARAGCEYMSGEFWSVAICSTGYGGPVGAGLCTVTATDGHGGSVSGTITVIVQ